MKTAIVTIMLGVAVAGSAIAAQSVTDIDYIRASRCKGLAAGSGLTETKGLNEYLKSAGRSRIEIVEERAQSEFERARRETRSDEGKAHYAAELAGACRPYMGGPQTTAQVSGGKEAVTR